MLPFLLRTLPLFSGVVGATTPREDPTPSPLRMSSKGNSRSSSNPRMLSMRLGPSFNGFSMKMGKPVSM